MSTALHRATDEIFRRDYGQPLGKWVQARRAEGKSWRACSIELHRFTDGFVDVTEVTLRNWFPEDTKPEVAA